ncbi:unnamed protein product [Leuciscus chuanchicus]
MIWRPQFQDRSSKTQSIIRQETFHLLNTKQQTANCKQQRSGAGSARERVEQREPERRPLPTVWSPRKATISGREVTQKLVGGVQELLLWTLGEALIRVNFAGDGVVVVE